MTSTTKSGASGKYPVVGSTDPSRLCETNAASGERTVSGRLARLGRKGLPQVVFFDVIAQSPGDAISNPPVFAARW